MDWHSSCHWSMKLKHLSLKYNHEFCFKKMKIELSICSFGSAHSTNNIKNGQGQFLHICTMYMQCFLYNQLPVHQLPRHGQCVLLECLFHVRLKTSGNPWFFSNSKNLWVISKPGETPIFQNFLVYQRVVYVPYPKYNELQCRHCKMRVRKRLNAAMNCGSRKSRAYSTEALYLMVIYGTNCLLLFQHSNSTLSSS